MGPRAITARAELSCPSHVLQQSAARTQSLSAGLAALVCYLHIITCKCGDLGRGMFRQVALQGWDALAEYPHIVTFLDAMKGRESWGPSAPVDDKAVVNGWQHKLEKLKSS